MIQGGNDLPGIIRKLNFLFENAHKYIPVSPVAVLDTTAPVASTWTNIDLSANVPLGTIAVDAMIRIMKSGADRYLWLDSPTYQLGALIVYSASEATYPMTGKGLVSISDARNIQYYSSHGGVASYDYCEVYLTGYIIPVGLIP